MHLRSSGSCGNVQFSLHLNDVGNESPQARQNRRIVGQVVEVEVMDGDSQFGKELSDSINGLIGDFSRGRSGEKNQLVKISITQDTQDRPDGCEQS